MLTDAFHAYFRVGDVRLVRVCGFDGCSCFCNLSKTVFRQEGDISFEGETDRIYSAGGRKAVIVDPVLGRRICVERFGSRSAVVWNPWDRTSMRLGFFEESEYEDMLCVEPANTREDARSLPPGARHVLGLRISLQD